MEDIVNLCLAQVLFQAKATLLDLAGRVHAHITVMPRLIRDFGDLRLILHIPQDKAIFMGMGIQPRKFLGILKGIVKIVIVGIPIR